MRMICGGIGLACEVGCVATLKRGLAGVPLVGSPVKQLNRRVLSRIRRFLFLLGIPKLAAPQKSPTSLAGLRRATETCAL